MSFKNLCICNGIICLLFGLLLLIIPSEFVDFIFPEGEDNLCKVGVILARGYGALLVGLGVALFISRKAKESYGRKGLLVLITVANGLLMVILALAFYLKTLDSSLAWLIVVFVVVGAIAVWSGILLLKEKTLE